MRRMVGTVTGPAVQHLIDDMGVAAPKAPVAVSEPVAAPEGEAGHDGEHGGEHAPAEGQH